MGLFDKRIAYKPFEYPMYYTEGWLKQAQAFWLHTEISMQGDVKDWNEKLNEKEKHLARSKYAERQIEKWWKWSWNQRNKVKYKELVEQQDKYKIKVYG